jgi:hypothetical protein
MFSRLCQRHLTAGMIFTVWVGAALVTAPGMYVHSFEDESTCQDTWHVSGMRLAFLLTHACLVFVVPGVTVAVCHASVGSRLYRTTSSLAAAPVVAAAAACEMTLLQRPRQLLLVSSHTISAAIFSF